MRNWKIHFLAFTDIEKAYDKLSNRNIWENLRRNDQKNTKTI